MSCAPEVVNGNIAATDRVLNDALSLSEFSNSEKFKAEMAVINNSQANEKLEKYFSILGIDPKNKEEVVQFIGSRKIDQKYIDKLGSSFEVSPTQAQSLAEKVQEALLGSLNE